MQLKRLNIASRSTFVISSESTIWDTSQGNCQLWSNEKKSRIDDDTAAMCIASSMPARRESLPRARLKNFGAAALLIFFLVTCSRVGGDGSGVDTTQVTLEINSPKEGSVLRQSIREPLAVKVYLEEIGSLAACGRYTVFVYINDAEASESSICRSVQRVRGGHGEGDRGRGGQGERGRDGGRSIAKAGARESVRAREQVGGGSSERSREENYCTSFPAVRHSEKGALNIL